MFWNLDGYFWVLSGNCDFFFVENSCKEYDERKSNLIGSLFWTPCSFYIGSPFVSSFNAFLLFFTNSSQAESQAVKKTGTARGHWLIRMEAIDANNAQKFQNPLSLRTFRVEVLIPQHQRTQNYCPVLWVWPKYFVWPLRCFYFLFDWASILK